ncbi:mechanosensitive ion channel family protein [Pacificimonas flava]|uniref:Potassium efflux system KefA protein / Small-conductance mechanosensitive channel n=1 Tax=Pacificimonas flava TaxID=1234595 RepID=M2SCL7_9SPHN|nr:mechanosensitive ion channel domain-containing protein [Pacificimonas flava]EMD83120.1 Potassium efflux system KefA protein / Small-conductance mechanosensitive channel [Pacificimonas flava]MBB5280278.1 small-conductance mechanosensitive channel [Pacificimonas flava]
MSVLSQMQVFAARQGLPIDTVVRQELLIVAMIVIAAAWFLGRLVQRYVGPRIRAVLSARGAAPFQQVADYAPRLCGILTSLTLLIGGRGLADYGFYGTVLIAIAIGIAVGRLVYVLCRLVGFGTALTFLFAIFTATASIASSLGGLEPLVTALDNAALRIGSRRISLLDVLNAILVILVLYTVSRFVVQLVGRQIGNSSRLDLSQRVLFQKLAGLGIVIIAFFLGLELLGIDFTALAVFSGAFGLALGFGMQKTFGNLLSGLILLIDRSIKPGDIIVVDQSFGWVNKIGVRAVSIITRDGIEYLIPNEVLMTERVENWSYSDRNVRIHIEVGVGYDCDLKRAQELMLQAAKETRRVLEDPAPNVWLKEFGEFRIEHDILCWIADAEAGVGNVKSAILNRIWVLFRENDITIPYPQRDVNVRSLPPGAAAMSDRPVSGPDGPSS